MSSDFQMEITQQNCLDLFPAEAVVYLTPDAEEGLAKFSLFSQF